MEARRREERQEEREEHREHRERRERLEPVERAEYVYDPRLAEHRDVVHWGPVWVGLIGSFGVLIVLGLLAAAVGFSVASPTPTAPGAPSTGAGIGAGVASIIAVLISFFVGGWLAGRTSSSRGRFAGMALGTMVWALGLVFLFLVTAMGIGGLLNVFSGFFGAFSPGAPGIRAAAGPAITALVGAVLTWIVAVIGSVMGCTTHSPEIEGY